MRTLCVEGWRWLHHSYAMVNQWQLLALIKRNDVALRIVDLPLYHDQWRRSRGLFRAEDEAKLNAIVELAAGESVDATYRIAYPYDLTQEAAGHTAVFGTSEYQFLDASRFAGPFDIDALKRSERFSIVTPSRWSREGFLRLGLRDAQVDVVPHGVAPEFFYPSQPARAAMREKSKLSGFVFCNASAMTDNKGIDLLLRAFAVVSDRHPDARLLLKGADGLYASKSAVVQILSSFPDVVKTRVAARILYDGSTLPTERMADFYRAADVYVSPYRAEGFNLPVLEALACGVPVICTKGGPTDEFLDATFARFIDSTPTPYPPGGLRLEPDLDHLIELMLGAIGDEMWRSAGATAGAAHAAANFNWDVVVEKLLTVIFSRAA
jgi:glycosyltransferase involved in cell wall biosynthesis